MSQQAERIQQEAQNALTRSSSKLKSKHKRPKKGSKRCLVAI